MAVIDKWLQRIGIIGDGVLDGLLLPTNQVTKQIFYLYTERSLFPGIV